MVEAMSGAILLGLWIAFGPTWAWPVSVVFLLGLLVLFFTDLDHQLLPDLVTLPGLVAGLGLAWFNPFLGRDLPWPRIWMALLGAALGAFFGFVVAERLGGGIAAVILPIVAGAAGGFLLYLSVVVGVFVFGGSLLAFALTSAFSVGSDVVRAVLGVVGFIVGGFLAHVLGRFAIIVGTSIEGAAAILLGACALASRRGVAGALPAEHPYRAGLLDSAARHGEAGLALVNTGEYGGEHWLATYAVYLLTGVGE